jgi:glycerol-3-phosphate acyltransferase PlsY
MTVLLYIAAAVIGYLLGSIPWGVIISRGSGKDVRQVGSGKTGMTNVLRTAGRKAAALALILDMGKGAAAVFVAGWILRTAGEYPHYAEVLAALAAIGGHSWSVFLRFKGGRGVATFIGGLLALYWPAAVFGGGIMLIIGFTTKYMSLGSISGAVAGFVYLLIMTVMQLALFGRPAPPVEYAIYALAGGIFIYVMHHDNISRLISGTERRLGDKSEPAHPASIGEDR